MTFDSELAFVGLLCEFFEAWFDCALTSRKGFHFLCQTSGALPIQVRFKLSSLLLLLLLILKKKNIWTLDLFEL